MTTLGLTKFMNETYYLVINKNDESQYLPYDKQFQLFTTKEAALIHAKSIGYEENFIGVSDKPGVVSVWMAGDVNVMILPIKNRWLPPIDVV